MAKFAFTCTNKSRMALKLNPLVADETLSTYYYKLALTLENPSMQQLVDKIVSDL